MKNINELDPFKQAIRRKLAEKPVHSGRDIELWEKVLSEIQEEPKVYKINYALLYAAATLLLFITVSLGYFIGNNPEEKVVGLKDSQIHTTAPGETNHTGEKKMLAIGNEEVLKKVPGTESQSEVNLPVASVPDFSPSPAIHAEGKVLDHHLPDGSVATLNVGSILKTSDKFKNERNVMLEGEAYFEVQSDKENPFIVYFSDYKLVVVGTKFNVRNISNENSKEVTVTEGIVRVYDNIQKEGIEVKEGEQLKLSKGEKSVLLQVDSPNYISWKTGSLNFKKTNLEEITSILSKKYKTEIYFSPEVKKCKFTGDLSGLDLDEILTIISKTISLKVEKKDNKIYITGPGCD